ncbi:cysteine dioxygenase [Actinocatenispora rupis]|uniref:Cysteine dioxygenase type I n=1 Tax=Actinocatenispora rupis TaxID=519421 RepID=A0A8J3N9C3_9ACTN|nr:cysteine dioxygenase family protein [Actinocatenispora rupis]GID11179.1 hypothetical protein Aru02nite_20680 [Actinocatenispora rupis]
MPTSTSTNPATLVRRYAAVGYTPVFDAENRWFRRLHADADHEAWLLTWLPGQGTDLHDHGGASGAFTVLRGTIAEDVVAPNGLTTVSWTEREVRPFGPHHVHRVHNAGDAPAVTLHVYAPGLTAMSQYSYANGELTLVRTDRAGVDW